MFSEKLYYAIPAIIVVNVRAIYTFLCVEDAHFILAIYIIFTTDISLMKLLCVESAFILLFVYALHNILSSIQLHHEPRKASALIKPADLF